MRNRILAVAVGTAALVVAASAGCEEQPQTPKAQTAPSAQSAEASPAAAAAELPAGLRLASAPADAKGVAEAKAAAKEGDRVVVRGVVGGRADPLAANRAILTLLDPGIKTCDQEPGDSCKTPWDACCEPPESLVKGTVTVQVVDADGRPLKAPLSAVAGVKPLAKLVVSGVVKSSADGHVLVNADGIFVEQ